MSKKISLETPGLARLQLVGTQYMHRHAQLNLVLLDQAMVSGVNFLTGVLLARFMGIEEFGRFTLLWMAILFLNSLQSAMIISPMMSIGPKQKPEDEASYDGAVIFQQLVFALLSTMSFMGVAYACGVFKTPWHIADLALPLGAVTLTYQLQEFMRRYFFTRQQPAYAFVNDLISYGGQVVFLFVLYWMSDVNTAAVLWAIAVTSGVAILSGIPFLKKPVFHKPKIKAVLARHLESSRWLIASTVMLWLSGNFLLIMAGAVLGAGAVGILKACQNILGITHILFNGLSNLVPVKASKILASQGLAMMERYMLKMTFYGGVATCLLAVPAIFLPDFTLKLLYGGQYSGFGWLLGFYAATYILMFFNQMLTFLLRAIEATKPVFIGYLLTGVLSMLFGYKLVSMLRLQGVVVGLLILALINLTTLAIGYVQRKKCLEMPM